MNSKTPLSNKILKKIKKEQLNAFTAKDFIEMTNIRTINKNLERLEKSSTIRRIISGVYDIPDYSTVLKEFSAPSIDDVAHALARANNWKICPSGTSALNYIGLSTQVPAQYVYVSSGPYKDYMIGNINLIFKHTNNRLMYSSSMETAILIQAIKAIGRSNITKDQMSIIRNHYNNPKIIKMLLDESKLSTAWIYETIKKTFKGNKHI